MPSNIGGYPVTWEQAGEGLGAGGKNQDSILNEVPRTSWLGPKPQPLSLKAFVGGATSFRQARAISRLAALMPFLPVEHANGIFLDETVAWLTHIQVGNKRGSAEVQMDIKGQYAGNPRTHDLGVIVLSRALANPWSQAHLTPLRVPGGYAPRTEVIGDAARNVIQTPTWFTEHDAGYSPGDYDRNGLKPVLASAASNPENLFLNACKVILGSVDVWGSGDDLLGGIVQNVAVSVTFPAGRIRVADRLGGVTTSAIEINPGAFTDVGHLGGGLPSTPWAQQLHLSNGALLELSDAGNVWFYPKDAAGFTITTPGAVTARALGSGVFYHQLATHLYLVSDSDWAVTAGGAVTGYTAGARFAVIYSAAAGATLTKRLREAFAEVSTFWVLVPRGRSL